MGRLSWICEHSILVYCVSQCSATLLPHYVNWGSFHLLFDVSVNGEFILLIVCLFGACEKQSVCVNSDLQS